jgi:ATP-dependent DNA helicase RecG
MKEHQLLTILQELLSLPAETEVVEFKEARNNFDFKDLGKYFSALSNEANLKNKACAWLLFGVSNKKQIVGTQYRSSRKDLDKLKHEIAVQVNGRLTFIEIYELQTGQGRVLMFQIPPAPCGIPTSFGGFYFGRDGESTGALNIEEIERIRCQVKQTDWSAGICEEAGISDLDDEALAKARTNFKIKNPRLANEIDRWDTHTFLNKAKLAVRGKLTNTAILLLGKPESEHFISPAIARITWVLKNTSNEEKDYEHFSCPFILAVDKVFARIRNLKYRYLKDGTLFPDEIDQYEPFNIKEALSNCIAHQDYLFCGRINVVEQEDGYLTFTNLGEFLPGSIESVIESDSPPEYYRNQFLAQAMVNLNMIDTVGSGIKRMFRLQSQRFFPMPDYDFSEGKVKVTITGKILDADYARVLAQNPDLTLDEIILLDKLQKKKDVSNKEIAHLKAKGLVEGRKPNFHISQKLAERTDQKADYIRNRGFKDHHYKNLVLEFIDKYGSASKSDIDKLILDILPQVLDEKQKDNKVRNLIYDMSKRDKTIVNTGTHRKPVWKRKV